MLCLSGFELYSRWVPLIDLFSQMKREYKTILDDTDPASRINFVPPYSFT